MGSQELTKRESRRAGSMAHVFTLVERAAIEGRRCPTNPEIAAYLRQQGVKAAAGSIPGLLRILVRENRIVVRVYASNWRDITICEGPHKGKATLPPSHGNDPYIVIDAAERARRDKEGGRWTKWSPTAKVRTPSG
jgi:hypothetical protein